MADIHTLFLFGVIKKVFLPCSVPEKLKNALTFALQNTTKSSSGVGNFTHVVISL